MVLKFIIIIFYCNIVFNMQMKNIKIVRLDFLRWFIKGYVYKYLKKYINYEFIFKIIWSFKLFKK